MDWIDVLSIVLAIILVDGIGFERELGGKFAGLRTNILICLGAAVFTILSREMGAGLGDYATRIAAQVVNGVGFLCAGAIIRDRGGIHGLTTAATIWLVASIGMACGARFYRLAGITTALALVVLFGIPFISKSIHEFRKRQTTDTDITD